MLVTFMNNNILEFLEAYKSLDELCKQILKSDRGVSEYLDEMDRQGLGCMKVSGWDNDYNQLKKMRWIRNRLVHDTDSFQDNLFTVQDIEWLKNFHLRIMKCTDPFSLLRHSTMPQRKVPVKQESYPKTVFRESNPRADVRESEQTQGWGLVIAIIILIGIAILAVIFSVTTFLIYGL